MSDIDFIKRAGRPGLKAKDVHALLRCDQGRHVFCEFTQVFWLKKQFRIDVDTDDGALLFKYSRLFMGIGVTWQAIVDFCEAINAKAVMRE